MLHFEGYLVALSLASIAFALPYGVRKLSRERSVGSSALAPLRREQSRLSFATSILSYLYQNIDVLVALLVFTPSESVLYFLATRIAKVVQPVFVSSNALLAITNFS